MYIKCWGSRGSIPVSGKVYKKYGGDTSCLEIVAKSGETIIVDAGTGMRQLGNSLLKRNIREYTILFTHAHWDHILGVAYFKPLQYSKTIAHIQDRMFAGMSTQDVINEVMKCPFFPIKFRELNADMKFEKGLTDQFAIGSIQIETIPTSHPGCGYGYKFTEDNKTFVFLTDNELGYDHPGGCKIDAYVNFSKDADLLIHDAEYTPEEHLRKTGWGHSVFFDVLDLAIKANVKKVGLFHINQDRTDAGMDNMVKESKAYLKKKKAAINCFGVACEMEFNL